MTSNGFVKIKNTAVIRVGASWYYSSQRPLARTEAPASAGAFRLADGGRVLAQPFSTTALGDRHQSTAAVAVGP